MTTLHGFETLEVRQIPEIDSKVTFFRHVETGAELLSVENQDENKVFGVTFRTPPNDSTGLPHIMEHSVLCGSQRYPVKEPFVELRKGSLQTFLNAFTYPDKTCYPLASQNLEDFYNLIDVYVDAVFHPLIPAHILDQEGWHYELEDPDDPLKYKGVVFNEMKGVYSDPDNILGRKIITSLFPDNPYQFDAGGDPQVIPDLTYADFKSFHENYYHPSNARLFSYGDDPPEARLEKMNALLSGFGPREVGSGVPLQKTFAEPKSFTYPFPTSEGQVNGDKAMVSLNWMLSENNQPEVNLALSILNHILIGTPGSPLRKALIESGLGEDLTRGGFGDYLRQMTFSVGLKGIQAEDADEVVALIEDTLSSLVSDGLEADLVEASMNTVEFRYREQNTGSYPRGIFLMLAALDTWLHEGDPFAPLAFEAPLQSIKDRLNQGEKLFEHLIVDNFLENRHRTQVLLVPDSELKTRVEEAEAARLAAARETMDAARLGQIVEETRRLKELQETPDAPEALATIPSLQLADLDKENKQIPLEVDEIEATPVLYHDLFTNGVTYVDLAFDMQGVPQEYLGYVPLFGRALVEMGTDTEDFVQLSRRIGRHTGGIWATRLVTAVKDNPAGAAYFIVQGKSTVEKTPDLLEVMSDILRTVSLDNRERFRQIVLKAKAGMESGLVPGGHRIVNRRLRARYNASDWAAEQMGGISYLFFLRDLVKKIEEDWDGVLADLTLVRGALINRAGLTGNVTLDRENWTKVRPEFARFLDGLPGFERRPARWDPEFVTGGEGLAIPAQVNYVGKGANLYNLGYRLDGSINVILNYLRTSWLWERVRVRGGAYGGFCTFDRHSGIFSYLSYRDPNTQETLDNFDGSAGFLRNLSLSQDELVKSIIGSIGTLDAYQLPDAKGYTSMVRFLMQDSDAARQKIRDQILSTNAADFKAFAEVLEGVAQKGQVVILGSQETLETIITERPDLLKIQPVL